MGPVCCIVNKRWDSVIDLNATWLNIHTSFIHSVFIYYEIIDSGCWVAVKTETCQKTIDYMADTKCSYFNRLWVIIFVNLVKK